VGGHKEFGAGSQQLSERRKGLDQARVVHDSAVGERNVKVDSDEDRDSFELAAIEIF
jgi:hypothetical protein